MINYTNKGIWLHNAIGNAGYRIINRDGIWITSNDAAVQAIIDSFDPLPYAKAEATEAIKEASAAKRLRYVTQAAGKSAEYIFKAQEAKQFGIDGSVGVFMQARMTATGETAATVAAIWNGRAAAWEMVGGNIAALEDKGANDIDAATDWTQCQIIADGIIASIEAI